MQAAGCAAAALAAVERKLSVEGVAAGSMLVWCAGAGEARAMAAATDAVVPLGTYDLTVASELGVAQAVLRAADSPLGVAPHFPVPPAAASALVHRVLAAAPPSTLRPPNDPFKYQAEVERALFTLRYHGVPPAAWEAFCATLPPGRGASQRDLAAIYAAAAAQVAAYHTYDHADVVAAAVRVVAGNAEVAAAVREEWPQALLVGAHHFSRPAVALARHLYGAARRLCLLTPPCSWRGGGTPCPHLPPPALLPRMLVRRCGRCIAWMRRHTAARRWWCILQTLRRARALPQHVTRRRRRRRIPSQMSTACGEALPHGCRAPPLRQEVAAAHRLWRLRR